MTSINFLARLAPAVEDGSKRHTVRRERKRPIKAGDSLQLFTGMRTKNCRRLMNTVCTRVDRFSIDEDSLPWMNDDWMEEDEASAFARADGLSGFDELCDWIEQNYGLPFHGVVIHWRYPEVSA